MGDVEKLPAAALFNPLPASVRSYACERCQNNRHGHCTKRVYLTSYESPCACMSADHYGATWPRVEVSEYRVYPSAYANGDQVRDALDAFVLTVSNRSDGRWAVTWMRSCITDDGTWEHEPRPSSREDEFLARCRFPLAEALRLAEANVDQVKINGRTLAEWIEHHAQSTKDAEQPDD